MCRRHEPGRPAGQSRPGRDLALSFGTTGAMAALAAMALSCGGGGAVWRARVVGVADGATLTLLRDCRTVRVHLHGVRAPRANEELGSSARQHVAVAALGRIVRVEEVSMDRRGRLFANVYLAGRSLAEGLLRAGLAWHNERWASSRELAGLELEAMRARRGIWAGNGRPRDGMSRPPSGREDAAFPPSRGEDRAPGAALTRSGR